ncbi:MAG: hypothetical protein JXR61_11450 [Prolixibacteraceae bacterium]|nr:hypothetical protein [Prolixibacteraceae bacterium]
MHQDKKQLEVLLLEYFRKCFSDFPKGKVMASESPDFIVSFKNRQMLGIELTRLNPGNTISPSPEQIVEIISRESLIELARTIFEEHLPHKLFVKFLFSEKNKIEETRELMLAIKLVSLVREKVNNYHQETFFNILLNNQELPKEIESVLIINHPRLKTSVWERSNNLGVSTNVVADIRYAIHKKDEKMRLYQRQRLNYYWLLIFTDRLRGTKNYNLAEKVKNHKFKSKFQHVFLFDLVKSDIYELI